MSASATMNWPEENPPPSSETFTHLHWSPSLQAWVSTHNSGWFRLWNADGSPRLTVSETRWHGMPGDAAVSPEGASVYMLRPGNGLVVWDARTGVRRATHPPHPFYAHRLRVSLDGQRLAAIAYVHEGELLCAVDTDGTRALVDWVEWETELLDIVFSPEGDRLWVLHLDDERRRLLFAPRNPVTLTEMEARRPVASDISLSLYPVLDAHGRQVAYARGHAPATFEVLSLESGQVIATVQSGWEVPTRLALRGRWLAVANARGDVERWDLEAGRRVDPGPLRGPDESVRVLALDDAGSVAVGTTAGRLFVLTTPVQDRGPCIPSVD